MPLNNPTQVLSAPYDVRDYGALVDGSTDDFDALVDCVAALPPVGGVVYIPPGTLCYGDTLTPTHFGARHGVVFTGPATSEGSPWGGPTLVPLAAKPFIDLTLADDPYRIGWAFRHLSFRNLSAIPGSFNALTLPGLVDFSLEDVTIDAYPGVGVYLRQQGVPGDTRGDQGHLNRVIIRECGSHGVDSDNGSLDFSACRFERNLGSGIYTTGAFVWVGAKCQFEDNVRFGVEAYNRHSLWVRDCLFSLGGEWSTVPSTVPGTRTGVLLGAISLDTMNNTWVKDNRIGAYYGDYLFDDGVLVTGGSGHWVRDNSIDYCAVGYHEVSNPGNVYGITAAYDSNFYGGHNTANKSALGSGTHVA